ncbi:TIGR01777 family oxidoreductase [bacterium]|nr:TIGR01777 family oxidoreductase [bacterium]
MERKLMGLKIVKLYKNDKFIGKILLLGGTGFIGNRVGLHLVSLGYEIVVLTREIKTNGELSFPCTQIYWDYQSPIQDSVGSDYKAAINLAGETVAKGRWDKKKKSAILNSRIKATTFATQFSNSKKIPKLIQASAVGYYGDTGNDSVEETSVPGTDFLADVCQAWEKPLEHLNESTKSTVMRFGLVLGLEGGAFLEMLLPYSMGVGAKLGAGKNYCPWIHVDDVSKFIEKSLDSTSYEGVFNLVAPELITYERLHNELTKRLGGFSFARVPASLIKLMLGEKSSLFTTNQKVSSKNLSKAGFDFNYKSIDEALNSLIGENSKGLYFIKSTQWVQSDLASTWDFFLKGDSLHKITPPNIKLESQSKSTNEIEKGTLINYRLKIRGFPLNWKTLIEDLIPLKSFKDVQLKGPYKLWHHEHRFSELANGTLIEDLVKFKVPFGSFGRLISLGIVKHDVNKIFAFRRKIVEQTLNMKETTNV